MLHIIRNPFITLKINDELRGYFLEAYRNENEKTIPIIIKKLAEDGFRNPVEVEHIIWLEKKLNKEDCHIYKLLEKCEILLPEPEVVPRNPKLEARIQKLRILEEERKYQLMTKNVDTVRNRHPEDTISFQVKEMNRQLIGVLQLLISVSAGWLFGFYGTHLMIGELDFGFRLILGIICACVVGTAEIYFFIKKLAEPISPVDISKKNE